jgi:hypothetical protein
MANEFIDNIVAQKAFDQVNDMRKALADLQAQYVDLIKVINTDTSKGGGGRTQALTEEAKIQREILRTKERIAALDSVASSGNKLGQELNDVKQDLKDINKELKNTNVISDSLAGMRLELAKLEKQYTALGKAARESTGGQQMLKDLQAQQTAVSNLEQQMGNYKRNVGNYSNATFQLSQSLRELPAFAFSAQTGILALSNNLPMLVDSFNQVKASTGSAGSALAVFGRSIFTFTNLFTIALGLFTVFYQDIIEFVTGVNKADKATKQLQSTLDASQKAFVSAAEAVGVEIVKMQELYSISTDVNLSYKTRLAATNELQRLYPSYLGNLKDEVIMAGEAKDAYNQLNNALMNKAMFAGFSAQAEEIGKGLAPLIVERDKILEIIDKLKGPKGLTSKDGYFISGQQSQADKIYLSELEQKLKLLNEPINTAQIKILQLFESAKKYADLSQTITSLDKTKPKKEKELDRIEELKKQYEVEKALIETNNNEGLLDESTYYSALIQLANKYFEERNGLSKKEKDSEALFNKELSKDKKDAYKALLDDLEKLDKEYNDGLLKLEKETVDKVIKERIRRAKANAFAAKMEIDLIKGGIDMIESDWDNFDKEREERINKAVAYMQSVSDVINGAQSISNATHDAEMTKLDEKQTKLEEYYDTEKARIEQSYTVQADKERELKRLDFEKQARQKVIDNERKKQQREQAKMDKAFAIMQITINTAIAVTKLLDKPPLAVLAGIAGAAQLAAVLATPIPQFAKGTDSSPEGYAIVGEKGTELVTEPSGKQWLTPAKDTLTYLKKGSKVTTNEDLMDMVKNQAFATLATMNKPITTDLYTKVLIEKFEENTSELRALKGIMQNKNMSTQIIGNFDHYMHVKRNIR